MVRCVYEVVRYTKIYIWYNIVIAGKLQYPATFRTQRCWINQLLMYCGTKRLTP
jgi:hypothetical protein